MTDDNNDANATAPSKNDADNQYEVGYGKPPKASQFRPGQSGNSKGKRKRPKTAADLVDKLFHQKVDVNIGGRTKRLPLLEVILRTHTSKAAKGDQASTRLLLELLKSHQERNADTTASILPESDSDEIIAAFLEQMGQGTPTIDNDE